MLTMMKDVGGIEMPEFFGKILGEEKSDTDGDADGDDDTPTAVVNPPGPAPKAPKAPTKPAPKA